MASSEKGFFDEWPDWSKPTLALAAMILLGGVWIGVPLLAAFRLTQPDLHSGQTNFGPMMVVLVSMTTVTISGIFIFMTFRIDRGTRLKAEEAVRKRVEEITKSMFKDELEKLTKREEIEKAVNERISEREFRDHVRVVLLANANGEIIREYARLRAATLDEKAATALITSLKDTVRTLVPYASQNTWQAAKVTVAKWWSRLSGGEKTQNVV